MQQDQQTHARNHRAKLAESTLAILEAGGYNAEGRSVSIRAAQQAAEDNARLYRPEDLAKLLATAPPAQRHATRFEVSGESSLDACRRLVGEGEPRVFVLNFASARNPGGGFLGGSQAQEESIARASGLYPTLLRHPAYYSANRAETSCHYTDHMIYSPGVPVFRHEDGGLMPAPVLVDVLTAPAPNAGAIRSNERHTSIQAIPDTMRRRVQQVLAIAAAEGNDVLVLGAWGCGVFQNDPEAVAGYFHEALSGAWAGVFRRVVFAIYAKDPRFARPFEQRFG